MRLSLDKIKQGILHPDQSVRDAAALHFAVAYTDDRSVMSMVTKALDTYGHEEAFSDLEAFQMLPQSDASVTWLTNEISRFGNTSERQHWEYVSALSWILAEADANLLKRRRKEIFELPHLDSDALEAIQQRTRLLSMSGEPCWQEFQKCCEQLGDPHQQDQHSLVLGRVYQLLELLSHHPDKFATRVLTCLNSGAENHHGPAAAWRQVCSIQAVGQMRLVEAIPRLIAILQTAQEDWVRDDCVTALIQIGGDSVVKSIWNACAVAPGHFYENAAEILECIHSDLAAEAALHLLQRTSDVDTKIAFAHALLSDFSIDGLGSVRQLILSHPDAEGIPGLRHAFLAVSTLMEAELPELASWREQAEEEQAFLAQWQSPQFPVVDTWSEQLQANQPRNASQDPLHVPLRFPRTPRYQGVGRNAPCPCNSGKKYKHCCLRRG